MSVRRLAALAAFAVLVPAHSALAQSTTTATPSGLVGVNLKSGSITAAAATAAAQAGGAGGDRKLIPRVFGGVWLGDNAQGFTVGGGVSAHPFTDGRHEIQGNAAYNRVEGSNGFGIDVDYLFSFVDTSAGQFTPYAGAGINITRFSAGSACDDFEDITGIDVDCSATETALQVGGGLKKPLASGKEFFVEAYIAFFDGTAFIARAGLGW